MDEGLKKILMIGFVIGGFALAIGIFVMTNSDGGGVGDIPADEMIWIKCNNAAAKCTAEFEMSKREFAEFMKQNFNPLATAQAGVICQVCNKPSGFEAVKCGKCEKVFFKGEVLNDFADRCPDESCGFSQTEDNRKKQASGG